MNVEAVDLGAKRSEDELFEHLLLARLIAT